MNIITFLKIHITNRIKTKNVLHFFMKNFLIFFFSRKEKDDLSVLSLARNLKIKLLECKFIFNFLRFYIHTTMDYGSPVIWNKVLYQMELTYIFSFYNLQSITKLVFLLEHQDT